nr:CCA tRNA nucleotidyltransferase [Sneathiella limimaris]
MKTEPPEWLLYPESQELLACLEGAGGEGRFVGGCVRDALLGIVSEDLDICTSLPPDEVMYALKEEGIRVLPTGLKHGTVTAMLGERRFEVTTLREDVETYGRHAEVRFTDDWQEDAARRDFTFNALYMEGDGTLHDYFGGLADLERGLVRFIGDPVERIKEDYLRILRYFRFLGRFSGTIFDQRSMEACRTERSGIRQLSAERIAKEILTLLATDDPSFAVEKMIETEVWAQVFKSPANWIRFQGLMRTQLRRPDPILRLAALIAGELPDPSFMRHGLRLSNRQMKRLEALWTYRDLATDSRPFEEQIYRLGRDTYYDQVSLLIADDPDNPHWKLQQEEGMKWQMPEFPVSGQDLLETGLAAGPEIGIKLKELEQFWIDEKFQPSKSDLLSRY